MVSKCANPECLATFRYLHTGKLFRFETSFGHERRLGLGQNEVAMRPLRRLEFYWLCENCAPRMTLAYDRQSGLKVQPYTTAASAAA
jgi:hypothetical protein